MNITNRNNRQSPPVKAASKRILSNNFSFRGDGKIAKRILLWMIPVSVLLGVLLGCGRARIAGTQNFTPTVGPAGMQGPAGETGNSGTSCSVSSVSNGAVITCGNTSAVVLNGVDGTDGLDGNDGTQVDIVTPCPATANNHSEQLLCIADELLAVFVASNNQIRLTKLVIGTNYQTTDGRQCQFVYLGGCEIQ